MPLTRGRKEPSQIFQLSGGNVALKTNEGTPTGLPALWLFYFIIIFKTQNAMRYPSPVSATSWYLGAQYRWQFVLVTYMSLWPFSSNLYGFYRFFSLFQGPCCVWARGWHDMLGWAHGRSILNSNPIHWEEQKGKMFQCLQLLGQRTVNRISCGQAAVLRDLLDWLAFVSYWFYGCLDEQKHFTSV